MSCPQGGSPNPGIGDQGAGPVPGWCIMLGFAPPPTPLPPLPGELNVANPDPCQCEGDPVNIGSGNVYYTFTDYTSGGQYPIAFTRTYNSSIANEGTSPDGADSSMAPGWTNNIVGPHIFVYHYDEYYTCVYLDANGNPANYVCPYPTYTGDVAVWHGDGSKSMFTATYDSYTDQPLSALTPVTQSTDQLTYGSLPSTVSQLDPFGNVIQGGIGYTYFRKDGYTEYYSLAGQILALVNPQGIEQTYSYNTSGQLLTVQTVEGNQLNFSYDTSGRISGVNGNTYGYDSAGNLSGVDYTDSANGYFPGPPIQTRIVYLYEDSAYPNALTGVLDEKGNRIATWSYDSQGRVISSQGADGNDSFTVNSYSTDANGNITQAAVTEPTGLQRTLQFTTINGQALMTYASAPCVECGDKSQSISYDPNTGFMTSKTDFNNVETVYQRDSEGRETSRTEANGTQVQRTISTEWFGDSNQPSLITEPGRTTAYGYDTQGRLISKTVTDTATTIARTTTYAYNSQGLLATVTDPMGNPTNYGYSTQIPGRLQTITNAKGQTTQITEYDPFGHPSVIIDPNNVETDLVYDYRMRLFSRTVAGAETMYFHDFAGNLTQVVLPANNSLTLSYDDGHRLIGVKDSDNNSIVYSLDTLGNRVGEQDEDPTGAIKKTLSRTYNQLNQLATLVGAAGQSTTYTADQMGNLQSVQDPLKQVTDYVFDALNRLQSIQNPDTGNVMYDRNVLDQLQNVTSARGVNTHTVYDAFGDVTELDSPDTGTTTYTYDLDGNRLTKTDGRGVKTSYTYDVLNRLTSVSYPHAFDNITYSYDAVTDGYGKGRLTGMTDASGTTSYDHDAYGDVTQKTVTMGGHTFTVGYSYDVDGNLFSITYPSGMVVHYGRDAAEYVNEVDTTSGSIVSGVTYAPFGPITGLTYGNGAVETRSYDQDYRLIGIKVQGNTNVLSWTLQDDADNNILSITDTLNGSNSQAFGYDGMNRLTSATGAYGSLAFSYDLDGNRGQAIQNGVAVALGYDDSGSNRLLTQGSQSLQYDAAGDTLYDGTHNYSYDDTGRLTSFDGIVDAYAYNGLGQRVSKFPPDTTPPEVSLTAPSGGAAVTGTVTVSANASDNVGVTSLRILVDGADLTPVVANPPVYTASWDTTTFNQGSHTLTAIASDAAGNTTTSAPVSVTIPDTIPPTVSMTVPENNAYAAGTVMLSASASDNVAVQSVKFQVDGVDIPGSSVTSAPYNYSWNTTAYGGGTHVITAVATDTSNNSATSVGVNLTVDNTPPTVAITSPSGGASVSGTITLSANASGSFGVGIKSVQFQVDGAPLGSATSQLPYSVSWPAYTSLGNHTLTAVATDVVGNVATSAPINVTVVDEAPTTNNGSLSTHVGISTNGTLSGTAAYSGQTLTFAVVTAPAHGSVTITNTATGTFIYTPAASYVGTDSFTFEATDQHGTVSSVATESITVSDVAAIANNGSLSTTVGVAGNGTLSATLGYAGQTLMFAIVVNPAHGSVSITNTSTGAFTYTPIAGYVGSDSLTFQVTDEGNTVSNTATESFTVVDVSATADAGSVSTSPETAVNDTLAATPGYTGQTLTFAVVTAPTHGTVTITNAATGAFTYTPTTGYAGSDSFTFNATDSYRTASNTATESVSVTGPVTTLSPAIYNFPNTVAGAVTSPTENFTLTNNGNAPLTGISVSKNAPNPGRFAITNNTCGTTLAAGSICTITVAFEPIFAQTYTSGLYITDSDPNGPQQNTLTGTGTMVPPTLSLTSFNFGSLAAGSTSAAEVFTYYNSNLVALSNLSVAQTGPNPYQFNISSTTCGTTLAAQSRCTVSMVFNPTAPGSYSSGVDVAVTGFNVTNSVTGIGMGPPSISPTSYNFGDEDVGTGSPAKVFTVTNNNAATLYVSFSEASPNADQFSVIGSGTTCGSGNLPLASHASCTISLAFYPREAGSLSSAVVVSSNGGAPVESTVSGIAMASPTLNLTSYNFGGIVENSSSSAETFTLTNNDADTITGLSVGLTGSNPGQFSIQSSGTTCVSTLAAGASCNISVMFSPTSAGAYSATLSITSSAPTATSALSGAGMGPPTLSPSSYNYGSVKADGGQAGETFTLSNGNPSTTTLTGITFSKASGAAGFDYVISSTTCGGSSPYSIVGGTSCTIVLTFKPLSNGTFSSGLIVTIPGLGTVQSTVTGTGTGAGN